MLEVLNGGALELDARELGRAQVGRYDGGAIRGERERVVAPRGDGHDARARSRPERLAQNVRILPAVRVSDDVELHALLQVGSRKIFRGQSLLLIETMAVTSMTSHTSPTTSVELRSDPK